MFGRATITLDIGPHSSVLNDVIVALRSLSTTAEFLISLGLLLLLTLATSAQ